jgi:NADPH:quinone reductase-like Zn-dependent oxidoreductase
VAQLEPKGKAVIVIDLASVQQASLAESLSRELLDVFGEKLPVLDIGDAFSSNNERGAYTFVLFLADYGPSFLASLDESRWGYLQALVHNSRRVLWVSAGGGTAANPDYGMIDGLARTLRSEYYELHLVTLALEAEVHNDKSRHIVQVAREMLTREPHGNYEQEYLEIDGHLHTRRLEEAHYLKQDMDAKLTPYETVATAIGEARFEMSATSATGQEDVPHYVESLPTPELHTTDLEIVVKAVSFQQSNQYCSGVVVNAGLDARFSPGDRVVAVAPQEDGSTALFHSHIKTSSAAMARIPDTLSFSDASWLAPPTVTAYTAFVEIGRVRNGDTVLVHEGASLLGQAAIRLLIDQGIADIWTTASSESEGDWIAQYLGLSPERILPRDWFESRPMLVSQWKGRFDIVLDPVLDSQSPLLTCWDLVRSGGKYIVVRAGPASSSSTYSVPPSIGLSIIHPASQSPTQEALEYAAQKAENGLHGDVRNHPTIYEAADLTAIFSQLQIANEKETIVVNLAESSIVNVRKSKSYGINTTGLDRLDPEATYLIAGGLGGLGRSMAQWLASRGARFLILLSRSGLQSDVAKELVGGLQQQGIYVEAPKCDITNIAMLETVLASCSERMPPIKGCIQSTMVVVVSLYLT